MDLMQEQLRISKQILNILHRRDQREEQEARERQDSERVRLERDLRERHAKEEDAKVKQRIQVATELLANNSIDASTRKAAGDFLKRLFDP
jgi:Asp-tRNA(Asn)/Glu-tRNA(Gln) amidotransferase A subunit family amidase